ncbi:MAG: DJ-1/PfpI family protein, partial [Myxococcales bacterium]|nr:DJ-1/PfpI family protein [Myxococcales bacterium]
MKQNNILVAVADGCEELETISIIDILRRADFGVRVCSIMDRQITCALGTKLIADSVFIDEEIDDYDAIVLPGGTNGAENFAQYTPLLEELNNFFNKKKIIAAICASPAIVFAKRGWLENKKATCYPALRDMLPHYVDKPVVVDANIITGQGPASAMEFAFAIAQHLSSPE